MKRRLKRRENPIKAPMQIQYQYSSVYKPLALRSTFPTVGASILVSVFGCKILKIK
jgi:hypothetical protein